MAQKIGIPYGSDVSAGTYICADCGYEYSNQSQASLPPCPNFILSVHPKKYWDATAFIRNVEGNEANPANDLTEG